jgi:hypothetical protein
MPLSRERGDYLVTTLDDQRSSPLIYPAAPQTIEKMREILRERRP